MNLPRTAALAIFAGALAVALAPPSEARVSEWMEANFVVSDGPRAGQLWARSTSPQVAAVIDAMSVTEPHTKVVVRKSAQLGYTTALIGWLCYIACAAPARTLVVFPTTGTAIDFNREKLQPSIDASPVPRRHIFSLTKKGVEGSNQQYKGFVGGGITITGANSAADLQSKTVKYAAGDEIDQWPRDLEGQGSPMSMVDARQIAFHRSGDYKKLIGGTPTLEGDSLVDAEFLAGDQRHWMMPCPHCAASIRFEFGGYADAGGTGLRFNRAQPFEAHYMAQCCGARIDHWQKDAMIDAGGFVAAVDEPGRHPSFHIDAMGSKFTTWDKLAETYAAIGDDPQKAKGFHNYWLGLAYAEKGDTPDHKVLWQRAETYAERVIPPDALIVTAGVDVQKTGLYVEIVGWTPDRRSYTLYFAYLSASTVEQGGDTSDPDAPCWRRLTELFETPLVDSFGGTRRMDGMAIDCRYNSPVVYDWVRRHHGAYALRTMDGWGRVPMALPKKVDFDWKGRRMRHSAVQWEVGSYNLKSRFYAYLRREQNRDEAGGEIVTPAGFCHFGDFLPEGYYRQLVDEYIGQAAKGARIWKARTGENHALDCRVLNMALAFGAPVFDLDNRSEQFWRDVANERGGAAAIEPLFRPLPPLAPEPAAVAASVPARPKKRDPFLDPNTASTFRGA